MTIIGFSCRACVGAALSLAILALPLASQAQQAKQAPRAAVQAIPKCPVEPLSQAQPGAPALIDPDCPPPPPPPPPPPRPPLTPASISYPAYTNGDSVTVRWSPSGGAGGITYSLYESANNGAWTEVHQGAGLSATLTGKTKAILSYRVRACRTSGDGLCSGYRAGAKMAVNPMLGINLYAKYPVLHTIDQRNANYRASAQGFRTVVPRAPVPGKSTGVAARLDGDEQRFYLGDGYDVIRGALREICLTVEHPQFVISKSPPLQPSTFLLSHVTDSRHLAELLEISASAKGGLTDDDFTLGFSGEKQRYVQSITDDSHETFVVKWVQRSEFWRLNTPVDAIIPELTSQVLAPDSSEAKADFRERCGDKFINSANLGAAIYLVFTFDAKKYDSNERQARKGELGLAIGEIFNGSVAGGMSSSTAQLLQQLNVQVYADQVGGPPGLAAGINSTNFNTKYNEFIQGTNAGNWAAVDFSTSNYQRPTVYSAYSHAQIFADFTEPFAQARRWLDITVQHRERCSSYSSHERSAPAECNTAATDLAIALDLCRETRDWAGCQHPAQYSTVFSALPSGTYLVGWLNGNLKKLNVAEQAQSYAHHVLRGSLTVSDATCLQHSQCFVNKFRGTGPGVGQGFTVTVTKYDNPKGSGPQYSLSSSQQCVNTNAHLETRSPPFGDTTADLNYTMKVEGFCADNQDFVVIP